MRLFTCQSCRQLLYFENVVCERCGHALGYLPEPATLSALEAEGGAWLPLAGGGPHRYCANYEHGTCNWLVPFAGDTPFCLACRHNNTVPDLSNPNNLPPWQRLELAKHRLIYTLLRLDLPLITKAEDEERGLAFDFLADPAYGSGPPVLTGHDNGLITINLAEADDAERERRRSAMGEPFRTLLGHFRHEVGHYFWDRLVRDGGQLEPFRALFGDETTDYGEALKAHYARGPLPDWQERYVSSYAAAHPWEDWAETWAHYLHIIDTLETARAFGLKVDPKAGPAGELAGEVDFDVYRAPASSGSSTPGCPCRSPSTASTAAWASRTYIRSC